MNEFKFQMAFSRQHISQKCRKSTNGKTKLLLLSVKIRFTGLGTQKSFPPKKARRSQIPRLAKSPVRTYMIASSYTLGVETKLLQSFK